MVGYKYGGSNGFLRRVFETEETNEGRLSEKELGTPRGLAGLDISTKAYIKSFFAVIRQRVALMDEQEELDRVMEEQRDCYGKLDILLFLREDTSRWFNKVEYWLP